MNLDNIISGRLPIDLPHLKNIVLAVPTKRNLMAHQLTIEKFTEEIKKSYRDSKYEYHEIDAEKDLLKQHPDYYKVMSEANKRRNDILLSLSPNETPDERFFKTPDEMSKMSDDEREKFTKYYDEQYTELYKKYMEDETIKKSFEYLEDKVELYSKTVEHNVNELRKVYWLVVTALSKSGESYFKDFQKGFDKVINLPYPEYSQLMEIWSGLLEGIGFPF